MTTRATTQPNQALAATTERRWPVWALLLGGAGLLLRLVFALLPLQAHLTLLEDDAWMVAAIARNFARGGGITADGLTPTNGFHPLYPLTLGALPYLARPDDLAFGFSANLVICALLATAALALFYDLARRLMRPPAALAALAALSLNPLLIRVTVNAMETALALLLLTLLWWYWVVRPIRDWRGAVTLGLIAALAGVARIDTLLAGVMLGLFLLGRELRQRRFPWLSTIYAGTTALLMLPYFARNLLAFGAISPSSGRALAYMHSYSESFTFTGFLQIMAYQPLADLSGVPTLALALGLLLLLALFATLPNQRRWQLAPLMLYALGLTFFYTFLQQDGKPRYYVGVALVIALVVFAWLDARLRQPRQLALACGTLATAITLLNGTQFARYVTTTVSAPYLAQPAMYSAAQWIRGNLPDDALLAAQNSGIFQYYSGRVVLNIDGKLNNDIIPVLEARGLHSYLRERQVGYVVDLPGVAQFIEFYSSDLSEATPHLEMSSVAKLRTYAQLVLSRGGLAAAPQLDVRQPTRVTQPFGDVATVVQQFPLPNDSTQAVTVWALEGVR